MPATLTRAADRLAPDGDLLRRFAADRDGQAFAELVRRHGPLVLGVCRRTIPDRHAADDAFQAAFLVLAGRAAAVDPARPLAAFLYGVAVRVSLRARTMISRRRKRETLTPTVPETGTNEPADFDTAAAVHEKVLRLPAAAREAVLLCELHGLSRKEAAARLGVSEGTLSSRLASARRTLAARLTARGLAPGFAFTALPVPAALADATSRLAAGPAPPAVESLARGALAMTVLTKLKLTAAFAVLAALAAAWPGAAAESARPARRAPAKATREPQLLVWSKGRAAILRPDGTVVREWKGEQVPEAIDARLSPDGKTIAAARVYETKAGEFVANAGGGSQLRGQRTWHLYRLALYPVADALAGTDITTPGTSVECAYWSADGGTLFAGTCDEDGSFAFVKPNRAYHAVDVRTKAVKPLAVPAGHTLADLWADGTKLLTYGVGDPRPVCLVAGGKPTALPSVPPGYDARLSPDGRRVLVCGAGYAKPLKEAAPGAFAPPPPNEVTFFLDAIDVASGGRSPVVKLAERESAFAARWSPDGKRVAYLSQVHPELNTKGREERDVVVCDVGGGNRTVAWTAPLFDRTLIDWR